MITAKQVKQLRDETGAGVMEAKNALVESGGDIVKAQEILKQKGQERAEKKADRATGEVRVFAYQHFNGRVGALVQLACETDFVAKTAEFERLGKELAMQVASMRPASVEALLAQDDLTGTGTVAQKVKEVSGKTGENVRVLAIARMG